LPDTVESALEGQTRTLSLPPEPPVVKFLFEELPLLFEHPALSPRKAMIIRRKAKGRYLISLPLRMEC
jgi:hypothetical protein